MVSSCKNNALRKMFPYLDIFWFAFSYMRTEYGDSKSSHCIMPECQKIRTRETWNTETFHPVSLGITVVVVISLWS